jgi:hypothetical protein
MSSQSVINESDTGSEQRYAAPTNLNVDIV